MDISINKKVLLTIKNKPPREGKIVYIFKAYAIPKKKKVLKYYGQMVINPKFARAFGPMDCDRIVIKVKTNNYVVCPLKGLGSFFTIKEL